MKLFALLFLVGLAAATGEWEWNTGKEYVFEYKGRLITGFPKLATQYSGMGMRAKIIMKVLEPDHVLMMVEDPKSVEVNGILKPEGDSSTYGPEGTNWRHLELPSAQPVPEEFRKILSKPVGIRFSFDGEVTSLAIEEDEPEWSINFKKGLVALFQTKIDRYSMELEQNRLEEMSLPLNGTNTWKIKEQSIDGICENQYSMSQLPRFYIKEHPETVPMPEACESPKRLFRITKLRNTDNCEKRSLYSFFKPGYFSCRGEMGANCSPMWSRSSYTTYIACPAKESQMSSGSMRRRLVIQSVVNEAELNSNLFGYSAEKITTGNRQILKLREIRPFSTHSTESFRGGRKTVTSLMYEFDRMDLMRNNNINNKHADTRSILMNPEIVSQTNQYLHATKGAGAHLAKEEIMSQIVELLSEVARDLKSSGSKIIEAHINMKLLGVSKGMSMLDEPGMFMEIYGKVSSQGPAVLNLFFDTVTISGTPVAVDFIKEMMTSGKMSRMQKAQFFMWIPQHLTAPTPKALHTLFDLIRSEAVQGPQVSSVVRGLAYSSLSRLIHLACISEDRLNSYPTWVFGEFCSPDSEIVNGKWVPFLTEKVMDASRSAGEKDVAIMSLGLVAKKTVIPTLLRVIMPEMMTRQGSMSSMKPTSTSRQLALYSLVSVGLREPKLVSPILLSLLKDPSENLEMRVAAFNGLMRMGPPSVHILQDIVGMTHQEVGLNKELLKVINTGLYSAGHQELHPNMEFRTVEMIKNARMAYHMVRKIKGVHPTSATFFFNTFLERLDIGYDAFLTYVRSQESFLPKHIFAEIKYLLVNFNIKPIQVGVNFGSVSNLHAKLAELLASKEKLQEAIQEHLTSGLNSGWRQIVDQLKEEEVEGHHHSYEQGYEFGSEERRDRSTLFIQMFEASFLYFNLDTLTSNHAVRQLVREVLVKKQQVKVDQRVEVQKVMDLVPLMVTIPSDMGFPINIRLNYPVTISFSGDVKASLTASVQSLDISGKLAVASQLTGYVGTFSPFTKELISTGVDQHSVLDLPGEIRIRTSIPEQKLSIEFGKINHSMENSDILHFHVIPFTVRHKLTSLKPLVKSEHFKVIESEVKPVERELEVGEALGLKLKLRYKTESAFYGLSSIWELLSSYKCPWNMLAFGWISPALTAHGRPSIRKHQFTASLDTSASVTKEIKMEFKVGYSTKMAGSPIQYHKMHVLQEAVEAVEALEEGSLDSPLLKTIKRHLPYRISSQTLEQALQSHPKRAEKLQEVMERIVSLEEEVDSSISAISLMSTITLLGGGRPRTLTYSVTLGGSGGSGVQGSKAKMTQKWGLKLEGFHSRQVCMHGFVRFPLLPMWNVNDLRSTLSSFELRNTFSSGQSGCGESSVETVGRFVASEKQRKQGLESLEAVECLRLTSAHGHSRHAACQKAIDLATTVDVVEIENKFRNVRPGVISLERRMVDYLRGFLWPYLTVDKKVNGEGVVASSGTYETVAKIEFHPASPSFDLIVKRPGEELFFENVHIRSPYRIFFPLKTGRKFDSASLVEGSSSHMNYHHHHHHSSSHKSYNSYSSYNSYNSYGSGINEYASEDYYRCLATPDSVITYTNRTVPYKKYYGCEHLLTGDCGDLKHFFVSEIMEKEGRKMVKINLRDSRVEIIGEESSSRFEVTVDDRRIELIEGSEIELVDSSNKRIGSIYFKRSDKYPLKIMLPKYYLDVLYFDGRILEIVPSPKMRSEQLCGLCGTLKSHHMSRNQICEYSTPELTQAIHRVGSSAKCSSLEQPLREQLHREKELCKGNNKMSNGMSMNAYKNFEVSENQCSVLKHIVSKSSGDKVCISKIPLMHCGLGCKAGQHVKKTVPFVCMPEGRMANYYIEKVMEGKVLRELYSMEESYVKEIRQVQHCVRV